MIVFTSYLKKDELYSHDAHNSPQRANAYFKDLTLWQHVMNSICIITFQCLLKHYHFMGKYGFHQSFQFLMFIPLSTYAFSTFASLFFFFFGPCDCFLQTDLGILHSYIFQISKTTLSSFVAFITRTFINLLKFQRMTI
jgi:hypothetical protein